MDILKRGRELYRFNCRPTTYRKTGFDRWSSLGGGPLQSDRELQFVTLPTFSRRSIPPCKRYVGCPYSIRRKPILITTHQDISCIDPSPVSHANNPLFYLTGVVSDLSLLVPFGVFGTAGVSPGFTGTCTLPPL